MAKFAIVVGHPDPAPERLNRALADRYAQAAVAAGHEVRCIDVARMDFALLRKAEDFYGKPPPDEIAAAQRDIAWADRIAFFYPLWNGDVPALFKAFIEQTFRPGFATEARGNRRFPKGLLAGKSARVVVTMGMPAAAYRTVFGAHSLKAIALNLRMCGIAPVRETLIGGVGEACERTRSKWFRRMASLAERDGAPKPKAANEPARLIAVAGALAAAAYLGYVATAWARFGNGNRGRSLIDGVMPEYDVRLHHQVKIHAPAALTFDVMRRTEFDRSPIVQALFRARELLLRTPHVERTMPRGLAEQLEALGWSVITAEPGRELVFGTVTQPWQASPKFRSLPSDEFARFDSRGYAKIALTLRVDPLDDATCIAETETRVATTDPASRAQFRRYWAFVAPGIDLIRIVLLQQLKHEAESAVAASAT